MRKPLRISPRCAVCFKTLRLHPSDHWVRLGHSRLTVHDACLTALRRDIDAATVVVTGVAPWSALGGELR